MGMTKKEQRQWFKDEVWLRVAHDIAQLGTCARRKVGVVFLDAEGKQLASGYNGPEPGAPNCTDTPCKGAGCASGTGLDLCDAIHAEQNATAYCKFPEKVHTVYCTDSPCVHCVKILGATAAKRIVFDRLYPHPESEARWTRKEGRTWEHHPLKPQGPANTTFKVLTPLKQGRTTPFLSLAFGVVVGAVVGAIVGALIAWAALHLIAPVT